MANDGKATRPEDIVRETINKDYIDNAVAERNIGKLASMIKVAHPTGIGSNEENT